MLRSLTALVVISISLWGTRARADDGTDAPANPPSQADISAAIKRFRNGQRMIENGDYAGAIGELEQAYQLDPQDVELYNLGVAHQNNGDVDKAIDYYRRYLAAAPTSALAANAQRYLSTLEAASAVAAAEQARAEAQAARAEAQAARAQAQAAGTEAMAARDRAAQAEWALRSRPLPPPSIEVASQGIASPPSRVDQGIAEDASSARGWVMPTALTAPAGTATLSDVDLFALSASYAFTDRLTVSADVMLPGSAYRLESVSAKLQLVRSGRVRIAAQGMVTRFRTAEIASTDRATLGDAGGALTLCIDTSCRSHLSGYLGAGVGRADHTSGMLVAASSLALGIGPRLKLVFELDKGAGGDLSSGTLFWYGLRITSRAISLDLGAAKPLDDTGKQWIGGGLPFIGLTYRGYAE